MVASHNSKTIYVFGGVIGNKDANKTVEVFMVQPLKWKTLSVRLPFEFKGGKQHFPLMVEGKFYMPPFVVDTT